MSLKTLTTRRRQEQLHWKNDEGSITNYLHSSKSVTEQTSPPDLMVIGQPRDSLVFVFTTIFLLLATSLLRQNKTLIYLLPDISLTSTTSVSISNLLWSYVNATESNATIESTLIGTAQGASKLKNTNSSTVGTSEYTVPAPFLTFDILAIGSKTRLDYLEGQRETIGAHVSVRHFFGVTEDVDEDATCSTDMTSNDTLKVAKFCHKKFWNKRTQMQMKFMRNHYASVKFLFGKKNPTGWLCAQTRPIVALSKVVLSKYMSGEVSLPDYLVIVDDDTHLNLPLIQQYFQSDPDYFSNGAARTIAGCLVRKPVFQLHFTIAIGGLGLFFSKGSLQKMIRPIRCDKNNADEAAISVVVNDTDQNAFRESWLCDRIKKDFIGEAALFKNGMSVGDLMNAYATDQPYTKIDNWTRGYCLHSDWMWGFFNNFYNLSDHDENPYFKDIPQGRMVGYNESEIYDGKNTAIHINRRRVCELWGERCFADSPICHYIPPDKMRNLTVEIKQQFPDQFRR